MMILKLALRNITRNPRRSLITVLAVGVGLAALIFLWAFMDGSQEQQRENAIRLFSGHIQIHAAGFEKKLAPELTLPHKTEILNHLRKIPGVISVGERVKTEALIGTSENSKGILLTGIDPDELSPVIELRPYVRAGEFLNTGGNRDILIGKDLADKMEVTVGDKVVIMTQAMDGTLAGFSYRVKGIFETGARLVDELSAFITLDASRELLGIAKESHEILVRLSKRDGIPNVLTKAKPFLPEATYEISTWDDVIPEINQWASYTEAIIRTMLIAVMAVIGVGVMNTVLTSIFERTREFGVMLAIGTNPSQIVVLIFLETLILEFIGIVLGLAIGQLLAWYYGHVGIHLRGFEEAFAESFTSSVIYPKIYLSRVFESVRVLVILTTFISFYPAWRVGRMEPVKAIYHS
jgi:ABC-type lipoprotein release transport system permease subunit